MLAGSYIASVCLATLSKMLLIALTLAWSKSFSAFLIICLALDVVKVDLSLMLTGTRSFMETPKGEDTVIFIIWIPKLQSFPFSKQVPHLYPILL